MWFWLAMGAAVFGAIDVILNKHLLNKFLFLKDKPTKHSWIATAIMILGVIMIRLG